MVPFLVGAILLSAPQSFDGLTIELPAKAVQSQAGDGRKVWEASEIQAFANGQKDENHKVIVSITNFATLESKPTPEQMLDLHEQNFRRRAGYSNLFARRTEGKAGTLKANMFFGYGRDPQGDSKTLASAAIVKGSKLYEVIWVTFSHLRDVPLKSITSLKFDGVPITGWKPTVEGEYSMNGFPFAAFSKLFIGVEMLKPAQGFADGYMASTLNGGEVIVDTRLVVVRLKPGDTRTDKQLVKDLAGIASSPFTNESRIPEIVGGSAEKIIEFQTVFGTTESARVIYIHKGENVALLSMTGEKSPTVLEELKKPTLRYLSPGKP